MFFQNKFSGEMSNEYFFVRAKLNWEALEESPFAAYGSVMTFLGKMAHWMFTLLFRYKFLFLGTTIMITGMSQIMQLSDTTLGIISSVFSTVARVVYVSMHLLSLTQISLKKRIEDRSVHKSNDVHRKNVRFIQWC